MRAEMFERFGQDIVDLADATVTLLNSDSKTNRTEAILMLSSVFAKQSKHSRTLVFAILMNFIVDVEPLPKDEYIQRCNEWLDYIQSERPKAGKAKEEKVLDLSDHPTAEDECIDLAKQISSIIHNDKTPQGVRDAIVDSLGTMAQPMDVIDSPEYIAKVLCQEVAE